MCHVEEKTRVQLFNLSLQPFPLPQNIWQSLRWTHLLLLQPVVVVMFADVISNFAFLMDALSMYDLPVIHDGCLMMK